MAILLATPPLSVRRECISPRTPARPQPCALEAIVPHLTCFLFGHWPGDDGKSYVKKQRESNVLWG